MLLVIDNFDSFTFNLVQYFGQLGVEQKVVRNNELTINDALTLNPKHILISPGPGTPVTATPKSVLRLHRMVWAIALAVCWLTTPCLLITSAGTP